MKHFKNLDFLKSASRTDPVEIFEAVADWRMEKQPERPF